MVSVSVPNTSGGFTVTDDSSAPSDYVPVTKHDVNPDPAGPFRGFIMDTVGAVKLTTSDGNTRTYASGTFAAGIAHGFTAGIERFWSTGTGSQTIYGVI